MKIKVGDIVEIKTPAGLAYAMYIHHDTDFGSMVCVFDKIYMDRPDDISEVTKDGVRFITFYPLRSAAKKHVVTVVGAMSVPDHLKEFPLFRAAGFINPLTNRVDNWWLWDGKQEWPVGVLTEEQRKLPIRAVWNHTFLIDRIVQGWRPENDWR